MGYKARARDLQRVTDLRKINLALEGYYNGNDKYPPTSCGIDGYDCTSLDASAYITSGQTEWASSPITMNHDTTQGYISQFLSPLLPEETSALTLSAGALEKNLAPYL